MDIQYIGGADPEMVFLDKDYNEVEVREEIVWLVVHVVWYEPNLLYTDFLAASVSDKNVR